MNIKLSIKNKFDEIRVGKNDYETFEKLLSVQGENSAYIATQNLRFENGDYIDVEIENEKQFLVIKFDETFNESIVFLKGKSFKFYLPLDESWNEALPEMAFKGNRHYISVRLAEPFEIGRYQNWALNTHDLNESNGIYPHASANVETRNDATFFARNVIDGIHANLSHGSYPYQSWGINKRNDAEIKIDFGRKITVNQMKITLRADFPHDNYWTSVEVLFSDNSVEKLELIKTSKIQVFDVFERDIEWLVLRNLKIAEGESPFPALTEIEVYGWNKKEN